MSRKSAFLVAAAGVGGAAILAWSLQSSPEAVQKDAFEKLMVAQKENSKALSNVLSAVVQKTSPADACESLISSRSEFLRQVSRLEEATIERRDDNDITGEEASAMLESTAVLRASFKGDHYKMMENFCIPFAAKLG